MRKELLHCISVGNSFFIEKVRQTASCLHQMPFAGRKNVTIPFCSKENCRNLL